MEREISLHVAPGICGFECYVRAKRSSRDKVEISIHGSECKHIQTMARLLSSLGLREIFSPITKNPVYISAQDAGCHPSCVIAVAIIKAAELAFETALPKDVWIRAKGEEE